MGSTGEDRLTGLTDAVADALPIYEIPDDDLVGEVLVPAMESAEEARIAAGFFSSRCLAQLAPGLAAYIANSGANLRVLLSPELSQHDRDAIERGLRSPAEVLAESAARLLEHARLSESALVHHTLDCLAYLVASGRLDLRFVLMQAGMYHKKQWLFRDGEMWVAVHGSGNATARGLLVNGEQMTVDRPWMDGAASRSRVARLVEQWDRQWENRHAHSLTLTAAQGLSFASGRISEGLVPTIDDFWKAWDHDHRAGLEPPLPPAWKGLPPRLLSVPQSMEWRSGPYEHQGRAVDALLAAGGRGVLAIATGGGKTKTALIAATELQNRHDGPMLVVVLVPSKPLMTQWADDVAEFGVAPFLPSLTEGLHRRRRLEEIRAALEVGGRRTEVIVSTASLFAQDLGLRTFIDSLKPDVELILVGDEMHNLGVSTFLNNLPERFDRRIGLSATPIRQYDPDGSDRLFDFFGPQVFEFTLRDAIRAGCLVPYSYSIHEVGLNGAEMDKYVELTEELRRAGFRVDDDGRTVIPSEKVERLLRERRAVLEQASAKLACLRSILERAGPTSIHRALIYASAKPPILGEARQIDQVNAVLSDLGIVAHQFTSEETARSDASAILDRFASGDYQALTAMKVLDEGVDIPQTDTGFILASSTVEREWVQRRGRVLRKSPGKTSARIHDFLVVPPDMSTTYGRSILRGELRRVRAFAEDCSNEWATGGPRALIAKYEDVHADTGAVP